MISGIGVDVVEIERMEAVVRRWGDRFLQKVFTENELKYAHSKMKPIPHIAGRFAVKEAVAKALTTGWSGGFRWKDVEVHNEESGKPTVVFHGKMKEIVGNGQVLISLSHSEHIVVAYAMLQS